MKMCIRDREAVVLKIKDVERWRLAGNTLFYSRACTDHLIVGYYPEDCLLYTSQKGDDRPFAAPCGDESRLHAAGAALQRKALGRQRGADGGGALRFAPVRLRKAPDGPGQRNGAFLFLFHPFGDASVSYTHLDVYKRQPYPVWSQRHNERADGDEHAVVFLRHPFAPVGKGPHGFAHRGHARRHLSLIHI